MSSSAYGKKTEQHLPSNNEDPFLNIIYTTSIEGKFHSYKRPFSPIMGQRTSVSVKAPGPYPKKGLGFPAYN
jgi:hypothetical protein